MNPDPDPHFCQRRYQRSGIWTLLGLNRFLEHNTPLAPGEERSTEEEDTPQHLQGRGGGGGRKEGRRKNRN